MSDELERFDDALRDWTLRPPRTSPAEAARAVAGAIRADRRRRATHFSALAAAAAVILALSATLLWQPGRRSETVAAVDHAASTGLGEGVVLMWLDEETPLYMTFQLPGDGTPGNGATP
jgi:ferric-dicitrate binding protein FerR (iron transport regulator)